MTDNKSEHSATLPQEANPDQPTDCKEVIFPDQPDAPIVPRTETQTDQHTDPIYGMPSDFPMPDAVTSDTINAKPDLFTARSASNSASDAKGHVLPDSSDLYAENPIQDGKNVEDTTGAYTNNPREIPSPCYLEVSHADRAINMPEPAGVLLLLVLAGILSGLCLLQPHALWIPLETRLADAYCRIGVGNWLVPSANGLPYVDFSPLYLWFLTILGKIPSLGTPLLFMVGACLSTVLFTATTWLMARSCGLGKRGR